MCLFILKIKSQLAYHNVLLKQLGKFALFHLISKTNTIGFLKMGVRGVPTSINIV